MVRACGAGVCFFLTTTAEHGVRFTRQFVAALTELTLRQFGAAVNAAILANTLLTCYSCRRGGQRSCRVSTVRVATLGFKSLLFTPQSSHAKRQNVNEEDVKMLARRQDGVVRICGAS